MAQVLIDGTVAKCSGALCTETSDQGLTQPQGIVVSHGKKKAVLYVADSGAESIFAYQITGTIALDPADPTKLGTVQAGPQQLVAKGLTQVSGLAMDGFGNLYYSTVDGTVGTIAATALDPLNSPTTTVLYNSDNAKTVSSPFALAADNFHVYWANQANGQGAGTVVKAFERDGAALAKKYPDMPKALAKNAAQATGVCVAKSNVFFTGESQFLYGVKTSGGGITEVSRGFKKPRACAYDGENTLYVADNEANAVFSLPANMPTIRPVKSVQKVADVDGPMGVAVFTRAEAYVAQPTDNGFLGLGW